MIYHRINDEWKHFNFDYIWVYINLLFFFIKLLLLYFLLILWAINNNGQQNVKPGNTIMYVSSDGLLHISGIMLGNKVLSVKNEDETEHLYWGDDKIC